ncbi:MAG: ATP-binding protein [Methanospirillaceae archaeon]|nr:ATP-binding protein [Methanospirillaceae archaeon]
MDDQMRIVVERQNPWWQGISYRTGINRLGWYPDILRFLSIPEILILLGPRRSGKSTLLYQVINKCILDGTPPAHILYLNFDDAVLMSKSRDPAFLITLIESYKNEHTKLSYIFMDEIQNAEFWAQTIKTIYDTDPEIKCILTGSSSIIVEEEMSLRLSGRYIPIRVFPLQFSEYLHFMNITSPSTIELHSHLHRYLNYGGFPRVVLEPDNAIKDIVLRQYYETIYLKDIMYPRMIRSNHDLIQLLYLCLSSIGSPFSYNKMARSLGISVDTVKEYISYAEAAYLLCMIRRFDFSARSQEIHQKKLYCADTGLITAVSYQFSENIGHIMENAVCISLLRNHREIWYHKGRYECDFLVTEGGKPCQAIQVAALIQDETVYKREVRGLLEAVTSNNLSEGTILTLDIERETIESGVPIHIIPLARWLMDTDKERITVSS